MSFIFASVLACALVGLFSGLMGNFLVVRRMSLMGDVLGHAILPGIVAGFVASGFRQEAWTLFLGALASGLLAGFVFEAFAGRLRIKADAAMAIVLTGFFGFGTIGLALLPRLGSGTHAGLDRFLMGEAAAISREDVILVLGLLSFSIATIVLFFKEMRMTCFDPDFAQVAGLRPAVFSLLLSLLVSATVVVSVQATGVVLASALLIIPAATASLLSKSFRGRLVWGSFFGGLAGATGAVVSAQVDRLATGPSIILSAIFYLGLILLVAPRNGWLSRSVERRRARLRHEEEDLLKLIYMQEERQGANTLVSTSAIKSQWLTGVPRFEKILERCRRLGWTLVSPEGVLRLSAEGRRKALQVVRNHRIWELYLVRKLDFALDHVHEDAEEVEHILTPEIVRRIEESLGSPLLDPHGRAIPSVADLKKFEVPGY